MCIFITLAVPPETDRTTLKDLLAAHNLNCSIYPSPAMEALLPPDSLCILTTRGMCDCGTALGIRAIPTSPKPKRTIEDEVQRLRQRGWGETKITRWREEKNRTSRTNKREVYILEEAGRWSAFLRRATAHPHDGGFAKWAAVLLHMYSGSVSASFSISHVEDVQHDDISAERLMLLSRDVLYRFTGE